ncbi:MAG: peptide ABC transporter substrate-binding protein [Spirochaetes bacterium]|nr:peptide ABC transporter substrate-binding protein [Spirochaetota bacterium]
MKKLLVPLCIIFAIAAAMPVAAQRKSADYSTLYAGELSTVNYFNSASENEQIMSANTVDGLVEYDRYGIVRPSLAKAWTTSPDGLVWTFTLKPGLKWVTWEGKDYAEVVAQDWVDSAKYFMTKANASPTADIIYGIVKNGEAYFKGTVTDFGQVGVKAKDKYTLEYTLAKPVPYFLSMLTYVSFLPVNGRFLAEQGSKFGTDNKAMLYNGAYIMTVFEPQVSRELVRNEKYWDKANVPIKRLIFKYNKEMSTLGPELFARGEITYIGIPSSIIDTWLKDPARKDLVRPSRVSAYTYFYALNFSPKFPAEYGPENWAVAVNNLSFRKALFHSLDRKAAMLTSEPYTPERRLQTTITPRNIIGSGGKDYVDMAELAAMTRTESFNKAKALEFKAKAMKELAGKASFPVKIPMPYNSSSTEWTNRAQVVEQQLETLLGKDFIDVIPLSFPATGFLGATRRAGNYAMQECNWGPDYADPETYTDPFVTGSNYNWPELAQGYAEANGKSKYENMVDAAKAVVTDMKKRYELFARAEAYFIDQAFVIPYALGGGGYEGSKLEPFTCPFAQFGMSNLKFKGQIVRDKAYSTEEYTRLEAAWNAERLAALQKAK